MYYGENSSPGHVYFPKHKNILKKELSNVKMVLESSKRRLEEKPRAECMAVDSQHTCSYHARSILRNARKHQSDYENWSLGRKRLEILSRLEYPE